MVWHHLLLLTNSFNKTEAAVYSCRLYILRAFLFISLVKLVLRHNVKISKQETLEMRFCIVIIKSKFTHFLLNALIYTRKKKNGVKITKKKPQTNSNHRHLFRASIHCNKVAILPLVCKYTAREYRFIFI